MIVTVAIHLLATLSNATFDFNCVELSKVGLASIANVPVTGNLALTASQPSWSACFVLGLSTLFCTVDLLFGWFGLSCFANKNKNCQ